MVELKPECTISVIIPVYNAAKFVREAVESALAQPETAEIILVEDGSPDDSLSVCWGLAEKNEKVHLYQHPGGVNRGAGPSRNLGILKSGAPLIAFLDADDFFLPERFAVAMQRFEAHPDCDGVYDAVGRHFEDEEGEARWKASNMAQIEMTTLTKSVAPEDLFEVLIKGFSGHIHLNGLVIRKQILKKSGVMNDAIADTLHEDSDFILRLAASGRLYAGSLDQPVAMRRVHAENRVSAPRPANSIYRDRLRLWMATYRWCRVHGSRAHRRLAFQRVLTGVIHQKPDSFGFMARLPRSTRKAFKLLSLPISHVDVVLEPLFWRDLGSAVWGIIRNDVFKRGVE